MIKIDAQYDEAAERLEIAITDGKKSSYVFVDPNISQEKNIQYFCTWLNKCFEEFNV